MKKTQKEFPLVAEDLIRETLEINYRLQGLGLKVLGHFRNTVYQIEQNSLKFIFKVYECDFLSLEEIKGEVELLNILRNNGIPVSYPIEDKKGRYVQKILIDEGEVYGVLFSFARGKDVPILSDQQLTTAGSELAKIHNITNRLTLKHERAAYDLIEKLRESIINLKPAFHEFEEDYLFFKNACENVLFKLDELDLSLFNYGYIHFDFLPRNLYFETDGSITFFDFEMSGKGYLILDLVCFYSYYFNIYQLGIIDLEYMSHSLDMFINAYLTTAGLIDEEINAIPLFGYAYLVYSFNFRYEHLEDWGYPDHLKKIIPLLKYWINKHSFSV